MYTDVILFTQNTLLFKQISYTRRCWNNATLLSGLQECRRRESTDRRSEEVWTGGPTTSAFRRRPTRTRPVSTAVLTLFDGRCDWRTDAVTD